ncbi:NR1I3 protein, partial [Cephalopterus ornatus]|nr:NR1I3 protein [Cephalopterus ornatus]
CAVCGDRATGYHFHVMSCEGCKGFFRYPDCPHVHPVCPHGCPNHPHRCPNCPMGAPTVPMGAPTIPIDAPTVPMGAHRCPNCPRGYPDHPTRAPPALTAVSPRPPQPAVRLYIPSPPGPGAAEGGSPMPPAPPEEDVLPDVFSMLPHFADLSTFMIQQVINFAKEIPVFRSLPIDAQISLLKGATLEICQIRFNTVFNAATKAWECGQHCYTIRDGALAGFQQVYLEPLLKFHESLRRLRLHEAEYALLQAMLLFSPDHADIAQRDLIDQFQEKVALTLKSYIDHRHPEGRFLYAKLLLLLTELQTLKVENTRQILHIQDLSAMTPLLSEIIS